MYNSIREFNSSSLSYKDSRIFSFNSDQTFYEISNLNDKWKWVRNKTGDVGLVPGDYLKLCRTSCKKQSLFTVDPEYRKSGQHELDFDEGEQVEVVQGNSQLSLWLVQKMDGGRGLIPSFHLKTIASLPPVSSDHLSAEELDLPPPLPSRYTHPLSSGGATLPEAHESMSECTPNAFPVQLTRRQDIGSFEIIHIPDVATTSVSQALSHSAQTLKNTSEPVYEITPETATQLLEFVRVHAQVSFNSACLSVSAVISFLRDSPSFSALSPQLGILQAELDTSLRLKDTPLETEDERVLHSLSEEFQQRVQDYQERSWEVLSDQHIVSQQIDTFIGIFQEADPRAVRRAVSSEDCQLLSTLSAFYLGEKSPPLRLKLVTALRIISALDAQYCSRLLVTTLASSLTNELLNIRNNFRLGIETARLATYLFSSGEQIPIDLYDSWNPDLFSFLMSLLDERLVLDVDECLAETLMALLLSFNLHFPTNDFPFWSDSDAGSNRNFVDMLMLYLNRDIDPVPYIKARAHSVLKMTENLISHSATRDLFDGSDLRILVDIGIRNLLDLSHLHPLVPTYLKLILVLFRDISCVQGYRMEEMINICGKLKAISKEDLLPYIKVVQELDNLFVQLI